MKLIKILLITFLATIMLNGQAASVAGMAEGPGKNLESISGSYMYHNMAITPNQCYVRGRTQQFCFQAISSTNDNDYVYYLWMRFPGDWLASDVTLYGEPYCTSGGTFGPFGWSASGGNEFRIEHVRYMSVSDTCSAYYCVEVTPGILSPSLPTALVSWYWQSSVYGSPPYNPCSSDGYSPSGAPACDEMTTPPAYINRCEFNIYLPGIVKNQR